MLQREEQSVAKTVEASKPATNDYKLRKEQAKEERMRKSRLKKVEEEIASLETENEEIMAQLSLPEISGDYEKLLELTESLNNNKTRLEELYAEWENLAE